MTDFRNLPEQVTARITEAMGPDFLGERHAGLDIDYRGRTLEHRLNRGVELRETEDGKPEIVG